MSTTDPSPACGRRDLLIALNAAPGLPRAAICRLALDVDLWSGSDRPDVGTLVGRTGLPRPVLERALLVPRDAPRIAAREAQRAARLGGAILTSQDPGYPEPLRDLTLPPPVLYCRGTLPGGPAIAIVGSRRMDAYGAEAARVFARGLAERGLAVVSGFAPGIDATAHRAALDVVDGRTVAVLGCGVGVDYPPGHRRLGDEIAAQGCLLTEFPSGVEPRPWHFPVRNRIIAALARATLVVEATLRSGSLVTARLALELGRDVFAVPGRIFDERALGTLALLRDGAALAQHPDDLLDVLPEAERDRIHAPRRHAAPPPPPPGLPCAALAALVPGDPMPAEALAAALDKAVEEIQGALLELELGGWVERLPGALFHRRS